MARELVYVIVLLLIGALNVDAAYYHVYLEPDKAEREVIHIDSGPLTAQLLLRPKIGSGWQIGKSSIVAPNDDWLWSGPHGYVAGTSPYPYCHMYLILNGYSSREYVKIEGNLTKPGSESGRSPWFRVTVPDVDIDWEGYEDKADEKDEDTRKVYFPVESDLSKCKKFIVRNPLGSGNNMRDDINLLGSTRNVILSWISADSFQVKDISGNLYANGGSISLNYTQNWPLELYVVPVPNKPLGDIIITLEGPAGPDGKRAKDKIIGSIIKVEMITPDGDPVAAPDNTGDGQNEFTYSTANSGVLTMNLKAKVTPSGVAAAIKDQCLFTVGTIGSSVLAWNAANPGGKPTANGDFLEAIVTFTGLPSNNSDFGTKKAAIHYDGNKQDETDYEVFYNATAANHPGGVATDPNWFYYYKQNAGGGAYTYKSVGRSSSTSAGGDASVKIGNEAYSGDTYITTQVTGGQLEATGWSNITKYYANFLGVLAHERQHANNETTAGPPTDADGDFLSTAFETGTSQTDPNDKYSARGVLVGSAWDDGEVYAGGPVEQDGIQNADTSQDWADLGTNSKP